MAARKHYDEDLRVIGQALEAGWEWRGKALRAGMVEYLEKPVHAATIRTKIEKFVLSER